MTEALTTLALQAPAVAIFTAALVGLCVALLVWAVLAAVGRETQDNHATPASRTADDATIAQQISSLQRSADHSAARRPRVRGNGCSTPPAAYLKAPPTPVATPKPRACGSGMCRKHAGCLDHACPGKVEAALRANSR